MSDELFLDLLNHIYRQGSVADWHRQNSVTPIELDLYLDNTVGARKKYTTAINRRSDLLFEELLHCTKQCEVIDKNDVPQLKLKSDIIKWFLSVQDPEKFTNKISATTDGGAQVLVLDTGIRRDSDESEPEGN